MNAGLDPAEGRTQRGRAWLWMLCVAAAAGTRLFAGQADEPRAIPVSAHNCYLSNDASRRRLEEALALGMDQVEIDLGWDAAGRRLIVGHDAQPRPGVEYAELETYLVPALEQHWRTAPPRGAPSVLAIDWKTSEPEAVRAFHAFLEAHADWFSSAPKAQNSPLATRRLTVCLTGSDMAKQHYDDLTPAGGTYRAFADNVSGAGAAFQSDVAAYVPKPATAFHRFLTVYWGHVERGGPPLAGAWTDADAGRLEALTTLAHRQGFRVRFYTLNGKTGPPGHPYRFMTPAAAQTRWLAARAAGADWVASDEYPEITHALARP